MFEVVQGLYQSLNERMDYEHPTITVTLMNTFCMYNINRLLGSHHACP